MRLTGESVTPTKMQMDTRPAQATNLFPSALVVPTNQDVDSHKEKPTKQDDKSRATGKTDCALNNTHHAFFHLSTRKAPARFLILSIVRGS